MDGVEEFKFKLAKAKDLAPTWFELVLRPRRFQEHLDSLHINRHLEPSPLFLIATFLEKAGCIEGQVISAEGVNEGRRDHLINCALFMGSFINWDLKILSEGLPPAVVYSLLSSLISSSPLSLPLSSANPPRTIISHILFNLWLVQFSSQCLLLPKPLPSSLLWEGTCSDIDTIMKLVLPKVDEAISLLMEAVSLRYDFPLPLTTLSLPTSHIRPSSHDMMVLSLPSDVPLVLPWKHLHCQIYYDVGQVYFERENYKEALRCFRSCQELLEDVDQLKGYLFACSSFDDNEMLSDNDDDIGNIRDMERTRYSDQFVDHFPSLINTSTAYNFGVSLDVSDWSDSVAMQPTTSKRSRKEAESTLKFSQEYHIWNIVSSVGRGEGVEPTSLKSLTSSHPPQEPFIATFVKVLSVILDSGKASKDHLLLLLKTVYADNDIWKQYMDLYPNVYQLLSQVKSMDDNGSSCDVSLLSLPASSSSDDVISLLYLKVPSQVIEAVNGIFQRGGPNTDYIAISNMLKGDAPEFISHEVVKNLLVTSQYNALIQKAIVSSNEKDYDTAHDFYSSAAQLLSTNKIFPNPLRLKMVPLLMEQTMRLRILAACQSLHTMAYNDACDKYAQLIKDCKGHYGNNKNNHDHLVTTLTGVFLLNLQQYSFIIHCDNLTLHERICPRLAMAAQSYQDKQDLRKCSRDLFETITGVFTSSTRGDGKTDNNQELMRNCMEVIVSNLQDSISLSYLIAALARLWNLIKKPEYELTCDFVTHWPTAVGHSSSIDSEGVLRFLQLVLCNSLCRQPLNSSWLIVQADVFLATGDYISALKSYLEAGAQESNFFEQNIPESIWNKQVYQRLITCCVKLNHYSHCLVLCQFHDPPNYTFIFSFIKDNIKHILVSIFDYLWDMNLIEYLIYVLAKQGDSFKQAEAIQLASRPELNTNNHKDNLSHIVKVKKKTFLKSFYQYLIKPTGVKL